MTRVIDATDLILGRMLTVLAKDALEGNSIAIVNCEKAIVTGSRADIIDDYKERRKRGSVFRGPYYPRMPEMLVKRAIRGMLPYKQERGRTALKRVKCYVGVPLEFKESKKETIEKANIRKVPVLKYTTIADICKTLGARI